tara:strand:+ start:7890 stop:8033 length:144 start_codon:yes stop_codon:yes gene_type:complete
MENGLLKLVNSETNPNGDYLVQASVAAADQGKSFVLRIEVDSFEGAS